MEFTSTGRRKTEIEEKKRMGANSERKMCFTQLLQDQEATAQLRGDPRKLLICQRGKACNAGEKEKRSEEGQSLIWIELYQGVFA